MQEQPVLKRRKKTTKAERVCSICSLSFSKAEHLLRHVRSHAKEKPFRCLICGKDYARQDTLLRHSRSHSDGQRRVSEVTRSSNPSNGQRSHLSTFTSPLSVQGHPHHSQGERQPTGNGPLSSTAEFPGYSVDSVVDTTNECDVGMDTTQTNGLWGSTEDFSTFSLESFLDGFDLDPDALNLSFLQATGQYPLQPAPLEALAPSQDITITQPAEDEYSQTRATETATKVQQSWHTYFVKPKSGLATPDPRQNQVRMDEEYHRSLAAKLQPRVQEALLPSTSFLDLCVQAYFANFHSILPIVHPSFRPSAQNGLLLLSICSLGSLFMGSARAVSQGIMMYERLNKAILSSWYTTMTQTGNTSHVANQASILGQTFGLLMGRPKDLMQVQLFHGSMVVWARGLGLFRAKRSHLNLHGLDDAALDKAWRHWILEEERRRAFLALNLLDAEISRTFNIDPAFRLPLKQLPRSSSRETFSASKARAWRDAVLRDQALYMENGADTSLSILTPTTEDLEYRLPAHLSSTDVYVLLQRIGCMANEYPDPMHPGSRSTFECEKMLLCWLERYREDAAFKCQESSLMMLWHSIFMCLTMDMDVLESALGRDGTEAMSDHQQGAKAWATNPQARRCLVHSLLVQRQFEAIPLGSEPPIHAAACLYRCGIAWSCFSRFGNGKKPGLAELTDMPELRPLGIDANSILMDEVGSRVLRPMESTVIKVVDLLQRITHWKVAERLASTLLTLIDNDSSLY